MDGHAEAQERTGNPNRIWLRQTCIAAQDDGRLDEPLSATALISLAGEHSLNIPGAPDDAGEKKMQLHVGRIMAREFGSAADTLELDEFQIRRT